MHTLAIVLPFRYMVSFPIEIVTGQLPFIGMLAGFAWQTGWLILALILSAVVWRRGLRHHTAVGG